MGSTPISSSTFLAAMRGQRARALAATRVEMARMSGHVGHSAHPALEDATFKEAIADHG